MRIGIGYDIHRFVIGKPLVMGGVKIPFDRGLDGHSDADVLLHALCDAIFGAAAMGDIGQHFPDTDPAYKNISSVLLLSKTWEMVRHQYPEILNIDSTIFAESPKISPFSEEMKKIIAATVSIDPSQVNIKATTAEGLGFIGRKEGIAAMCVIMLA